ncbi:sigma-E factor negative regulatory protein [Undibacterium arcticum]
MKQEEISALADGELGAPQLDAVLSALRRPDQHVTWDIYHQIGDALRSDDLGIALSPDFFRQGWRPAWQPNRRFLRPARFRKQRRCAVGRSSGSQSRAWRRWLASWQAWPLLQRRS